MGILHDQSIDGNARGLGHPLVIVDFLRQDPQAATINISRQYVPHQSTYVFHEHGAFIAGPVPVSKSWDQAPRIHFQEPIRLLIRIDLNVLIIEVFDLKRYPYSLDERANSQIQSAKHTVAAGASEPYQKQLPMSFSSWSLACFFTVASAAPVALL